MRKFIFITLLCALVVFGCEDKSDTHQHTWGEWQYNATEHWKECSCGEEYGRANHTGDPCTVCDYETPQDHESDSVTLFGIPTIIKGDASIPKADFDLAVGNLVEALSEVSGDPGLPLPIRNGFISIMNSGIRITSGNAVPARVDGVLRVGSDYLKTSNKEAIQNAIVTIAADAF